MNINDLIDFTELYKEFNFEDEEDQLYSQKNFKKYNDWASKDTEDKQKKK